MKKEPPKTAEELLQRYADGERVFEDIEIDEEWNLNGANLQGAQFLRCWFLASFHNANLRDTFFQKCNLKCSDFKNADLTNAVILDSALCATWYKDAKLEGANFAGSNWHGHIYKAGENLTELALHGMPEAQMQHRAR